MISKWDYHFYLIINGITDRNKNKKTMSKWGLASALSSDLFYHQFSLHIPKRFPEETPWLRGCEASAPWLRARL